jgi:hypothetical protein
MIFLAAFFAALSLAISAEAQTGAQLLAAAAVPAPSAAVEMSSRDPDGRLVIRAQRLPERLVIDGRLDETAYASYLPASQFVQFEPRYNEPATEKTELWVFFDDRAIYIGLRCFDSGMDQWSSIDMRRDTPGTAQGETVSIAFDTFHDRRNGYSFGVNPDGGISDATITNERDYNRDWNTVWDTRTGRFDGGWTVEMAIPFKSLRYSPGQQTWGINVRRAVKWKNETSYLNPVPQSGQFSAMFGLFRFSSAATLVGLTVPPESRLIEIKPYAISSLKSDLTADVPVSNDIAGNLGLDAKIGLTRGLTADLTYNTDFAQVEEDEQQVNLTRFSLFFPEKREFFLEGQGIFAFGGVTQRRSGNPGEIPMPFFSRRIGIDDDGHALPILGGGRVTGRVGKYSVGLVNIQTRHDSVSTAPATNFSVVRLRRDILRRSNVGLMVVNRAESGVNRRSNQTYGMDGVFSFFQNLNLNTYFARTRTPELRGEDRSYRAQLEYNADRYGLVLEHMLIGEDFNPETGYVRRKNTRRNMAEARFSPRPRSSSLVRKYEYSLAIDQYDRATDGILETRLIEAVFGIEFQSSDRFALTLSDNVEGLTEPYEVADQVDVPIGRYQFKNLNVRYDLGTQHRLAGDFTYDYGGFFGGSKHTIGFSRARVEPMPNLFVEPGVSLNWVDIPQGSFVAKVLNSRVTYTFTPRSFVGALVQYNSDHHTLSINARFRWEYRPGSDLFVVYSDGRDTMYRGFPRMETRTFTVKLTRFFRV